jgi:hypothetical protein
VLKRSGIAHLTLEQRTTWRVRTSAGDVLIPDGATAMTRDGPLSGSTIAERVRSGERVAIDTVSPAVLPTPAVKPGVLKAGQARLSLALLQRPYVQLPQNGAADLAGPLVEQILSTADLEWDRREDQRWITYRFELLEAQELPRDPGPLLEPLRVLTAWQRDGDQLTSRIRVEEAQLRSALIAAWMACKLPFDVSWRPIYYPVESRVGPRAGGGWPVYLPAVTATAEVMNCVRVDCQVGGRPLSGTALVA